MIYYSLDSLTPFGTILKGMITNGNVRNTYIMDLQTGKSTKYVDAMCITWVQ